MTDYPIIRSRDIPVSCAVLTRADHDPRIMAGRFYHQQMQEVVALPVRFEIREPRILPLAADAVFYDGWNLEEEALAQRKDLIVYSVRGLRDTPKDILNGLASLSNFFKMLKFWKSNEEIKKDSWAERAYVVDTRREIVGNAQRHSLKKIDTSTVEVRVDIYDEALCQKTPGAAHYDCGQSILEFPTRHALMPDAMVGRIPGEIRRLQDPVDPNLCHQTCVFDEPELGPGYAKVIGNSLVRGSLAKDVADACDLGLSYNVISTPELIRYAAEPLDGEPRVLTIDGDQQIAK